MRGEEKAVKILQSKGYRVIEQNYHAPGGEIDIITEKNNEWVLIEVKMRSQKESSFGDIYESIPPAKQKKIIKAAVHYFLQTCNMKEVPFFRIDALLLWFDDGNLLWEHIEDIVDNESFL